MAKLWSLRKLQSGKGHVSPPWTIVGFNVWWVTVTHPNGKTQHKCIGLPGIHWDTDDDVDWT